MFREFLEIGKKFKQCCQLYLFFRLSRLHVHGVHDDERLAHPSDQRPIRRQRTMSMNLQNFSVSVTFSHHLEALQRKKFLSISTVENDIIDTASCKVA